MSLIEMFSECQTHLEEDQVKREGIKTAVRELEKKAREIVSIVQAIHHKADSNNINDVCLKAKAKFPEVVTHLETLANKIPSGQYYRYNNHWSFILQRIVFLATYIHYLECEELLSREQVAEMLNVKTDWKDGFHLDLDDYLIGVLQLGSELSRLCVNVVIAGEYSKPSKIGLFLSDLDAAFRLLNLKNDALRKRFDALKYDLKKVEEVVYDLSVRGLKTN